MKTLRYMYLIIFWFVTLLCLSCGSDNTTASDDDNTTIDEYSGTASITQGRATTVTENLYPPGQRVAGVGTITATDNSVWIVPAEVNYTNSSFPLAPDLFNPDGIQFTTAAEALAAFDDDAIVEVDSDGEVITGYIFADNYFELYVNRVPVGKDAIPFTEFNSHIVKFRVSRPFTVSMKLVDWEENLGLGSEYNQGSDFYAGDGGVVAVFKNNIGNTIATTGSEWKAQTFYTSPIKDLNCVSESGTTRISSNCDTASENDGTSFFALHWQLPDTWMEEGFDTSDWPDATTYTNETIVVHNKPSYTYFTDIFDDPENDAEFIWSTNIILDNEVIVSYTIQ
ncbi:hypothetical protein J8281_00570 [Aquimarina sp. U1-2]|uniref:hypothetical protein n=1 Tax=Aquimarina sp. U1-2 TaxID=2823141 RepID=UPI001AECA674|nr:hypothetical protein [Aquimarina sp. U1-2]MBP2830663.1 hypothetical protein [Aquimarina sp. U1-2]